MQTIIFKKIVLSRIHKESLFEEKEKMKRRSKIINIEELRKRHDGLCGYLLDSGMKHEIVERLSRKEAFIQADSLKRKEVTRKERKKISKEIDEEMDERERKRK